MTLRSIGPRSSLAAGFAVLIAALCAALTGSASVDEAVTTAAGKVGPLLQALGRNIIPCGGTGTAHAMKALANYVNIGSAIGLGGTDRTVAFLPNFHTAGINLHALPVLIAGFAAQDKLVQGLSLGAVK